MTLGEKIKSLRQSQNITQEALAKATGISEQSIYKCEKGLLFTLPIHKIEKLALVLNTSPAYLLEWTDDTQRQTYSGALDAERGDSIFFKEVIDVRIDKDITKEKLIYSGEKIEIIKSALDGIHRDKFFIMKITDDSMSPRIVIKDKILVYRCNSVESGEVAIVYFNGKTAIRRVIYRSDSIELIPSNNAFPSRIIEGDSFANFRIIGKIARLVRKDF